MRFKSLRLPAEQEAGGVSLAATAGLMLAKELAPNLIGKLVGKKDNAVVETVVSNVVDVAMDLAGVETPEAALDVIHSDPEVQKVAKQEATKILVAELQAETRRQELQAQEMQSARTMYASGENSIQRLLVAGAFTFAAAGLGIVAYMNVQGIEPTTLTVSIVTASIGPLLTVFGFFFGSSIGSKQKTGVMSDGIKSLSGRK